MSTLPPNARDLLVWQAAWRPGYCRLGPLEEVPKAGELAYAVPRATAWPAAARFSMLPAFPDDTLLADRLVNHSGLVVVSAKIVEFLRGQEIGPTEFLPVTILDHRGHSTEGGYHVVNPLEPVACLDLDSCQPTWNKLLPDKVRRVRRLVLREDAVATRRLLFGCRPYYGPKLVHRRLASAMIDAGFTGSEFVAPADYRA